MKQARAKSRIFAGVTFVLVMLVAACSPGGGSPAPTPGPTIIPGPTGGASLNSGDLRMLLLDRFGPLWYCDRDEYPVGRDETEGMRASWPDVIADAELLAVLLERLDLASTDPSDLTDPQRLDVYRLWKVAEDIRLESIGGGRYRFDYLARPIGGAAEGRRTAGIIDNTGEIFIEQEAAAGEPMCPICLAQGTRIDAPGGSIAVERLRIGDRIWTLDADGRRVIGTVLARGSATAPVDHTVVRLVLVDGRTVTASPGHPLADGRQLGELGVGDWVDGSRVASVAREAYGFGATFDLVVSGPTGTYLVDGIPMGSTID